MIFRATDPELAKLVKPLDRNADFEALVDFLGTRYLYAVTGLVASHDETGFRRAYMAGEANTLRELVHALTHLLKGP